MKKIIENEYENVVSIDKFDVYGYIENIRNGDHPYMNNKDSYGYSRVDIMEMSAKEAPNQEFYLITFIDNQCNTSAGQVAHEVVFPYEIKESYTIHNRVGDDIVVEAGIHIDHVDWTYGIGNVFGNCFGILDYKL